MKYISIDDCKNRQFDCFLKWPNCCMIWVQIVFHQRVMMLIVNRFFIAVWIIIIKLDVSCNVSNSFDDSWRSWSDIRFSLNGRTSGHIIGLLDLCNPLFLLNTYNSNSFVVRKASIRLARNEVSNVRRLEFRKTEEKKKMESE